MTELKDYLWSVSNKLVKENDFSLLEMHKYSEESLSELHLIKNIKRDYLYIRLIPVAQYLWPNHLQKDIEGIMENAYKQSKQIMGGRFKFLNVYLFSNSPNEEIHRIISNHSYLSQKNADVFVGYIDLEEKQMGIQKDTLEKMNLTMEAFTFHLENNPTDNTKQMIDEIKLTDKKRRDSIEGFFNYGKPLFTYILIAIHAILFIMMELTGGSTNNEVLLRFGAKEGYLISIGEYWRFITPIFLHIGIVHFALNNLALYYLGRLSEKLYGSFRFFIIYLLAGIIGNISSLIFNESSISAGASGAIFGVFGALLYFGYVYPDLFFRTMGRDVITIIVINLIFGFTVPSVDNSAHIGGLIGGFIVAAIITLPKQKIKIMGMRIIASIALFAILAMTVFAVNNWEIKGSQAVIIKGINELDEGNIEKASEIFQHLVKVYPENFYNYYYYGVALLRVGEYEKAKSQFEEVLQRESHFPDAHFKLAYTYLFDDNIEEAIFHLEKTLEQDPEFEPARKLLNDIKMDKIK